MISRLVSDRGLRAPAGVFVLASALTVCMAAPVLRHPSQYTVGNEIAGRYRDPFVVMRQYEAGAVPAPYLQPATDLPGLGLGRLVGGVAAYNAIDLLSFPLAAAAAYLLTWRLTQSRMASLVAAIAFAWSPFHLAHASYHLHIAQVQWLPLMLLAAWLFAARPSAPRLTALAGAAVVTGLTSFYWGLVAAVILPPALIAAAILTPATADRRVGRVAVATGVALVLVAAAMAGLIGARLILPGELSQHAVAPGEAGLYATHWWHYLLPPLDHPRLGPWARARFASDEPGWTLLEQQVGPGWSVIALAAAGLGIGVRDPRWRGPVLWIFTVALAAGLCSMAPVAGVLAAIAPMFRAFARFGGIVTLCAAVLAGIGARGLWRGDRLRWVAVVLLVCAALELRPAAARARDILPTDGFRWLASHGGEWRVLDCTSPGPEYGASVAAVVGGRAGFREPPFDDCAEPALAGKLASHRYTHLLIRKNSREGQWLVRGGAMPGLSRLVETPGDIVLAVHGGPSVVYLSGTGGFHGREFDEGRTWRWMPRAAHWLVTNAATTPARVTLDVKGDAFNGPRELEAWIAGARIAAARIERDGWHRLGPFTLVPGETRLDFRVPEGDLPGDRVFQNGDLRPLAMRFDDWRWLPVAAAGGSR